MSVTSKTPRDAKIFISGIAGLVGQNLALRLTQAGYTNVCGIDKHAENLAIFRKIQPTVETGLADLADKGDWETMVHEADVIVINQAQIGGLDYDEFVRNNVTATKNILDAMDEKKNPYVVQISSSVVNSQADDFYTRSKIAQEEYVKEVGINGVILRPTLMFGWFDRKHLGWLRRFMAKTPVFPIPGHGRYRRQPLYTGDFCNVIISSIEKQIVGETYDISGREIIDYIDLIKTIKTKTGERTSILKIPYPLFFALIWTFSLFSKNPPFTIHQLRALIIPEVFDVIDWPEIFGVKQTSFADAVDETYNHDTYSQIVLNF